MEINNNFSIIIDSITNFLVQNDNKDLSTKDLYNKWSFETGIIIDNDEITEKAIKFLGESRSMDVRFLQEYSKIKNTR